jgi:hypothetical protein
MMIAMMPVLLDPLHDHIGLTAFEVVSQRECYERFEAPPDILLGGIRIILQATEQQ